MDSVVPVRLLTGRYAIRSSNQSVPIAGFKGGRSPRSRRLPTTLPPLGYSGE